ncbi:hypothetical protein [Streptomyces sp. NPDC090022]|uniref:hypothetical protein n=1 Tax=Streptomyces sp. NPDC090022 TaxID=3365920 RepID=UPI003802F503
MLWPADEPWPVCTAVRPRGTGYRLADVRRARQVHAASAGRRKTDAGLEILAALKPGSHAPEIRNEDPVPMLAVAQLWTRDIPDLRGPACHDLLQVLWCPFETHGQVPSRASTSS